MIISLSMLARLTICRLCWIKRSGLSIKKRSTRFAYCLYVIHALTVLLLTAYTASRAGRRRRIEKRSSIHQRGHTRKTCKDGGNVSRHCEDRTKNGRACQPSKIHNKAQHSPSPSERRKEIQECNGRRLRKGNVCQTDNAWNRQADLAIK
jgi:hypothetical protein